MFDFNDNNKQEAAFFMFASLDPFKLTKLF